MSENILIYLKAVKKLDRLSRLITANNLVEASDQVTREDKLKYSGFKADK